MMKQTFSRVLPAFALLLGLLSSCSNPASKVTKADYYEGEIPTLEDGPGQVFSLTPESKIEFVGSKVTGQHTGGFKTVTGSLKTDGKQLLQHENKVVIDMKSTYSDNEKLTKHLLSADFFEVETYPTATFELLAANSKGRNQYQFIGKFTLHGVTKTLAFPGAAFQEGDKLRMQAEFAINRKDFGIVYPGKPDDLIRNEVVITLDLVGNKQA